MKTLSGVTVCLFCLIAGSLTAQQAVPTKPSLLRAAFSKLPIYFTENPGVYPDEVAYYVQGADKTLFFTSDGITYRLRGMDRGWVVKLEFVGANPDVRPRGDDRQQAVVSYFKGPEKDWKTGLKTYAKIVYEDLWPGIDLVYRGTVNKLKYEFVVKPGADPKQIRLRYTGAEEVRITDAGALDVTTPVGGFEDGAPVAFQAISGQRRPVDVAFVLDPARDERTASFGFRVGLYDRSVPLIVDPAVLVYCGYIGGSAFDVKLDIAVDGTGNAYVTGWTGSSEQTFPVRVGPDLSQNGSGDAFVAKVNPQGTALLYCGYIGGADEDHGSGIAVDSTGNAYVIGSTRSNESTFPVRKGPSLSFSGYAWNAFVAEVNPTGTALVYCGYIGGIADDLGRDIAVDVAGCAYVTGWTSSDQRSFPVKMGPDLTVNGSHEDAFVAKVNSQGTGLEYCGYIGGRNPDLGLSIALDAAGNAYVTGQTASDEQTFPVRAGPDLTFNGNIDVFVAKVNPQGTSLVYCGFIGGAGGDTSSGIAVDAAMNAYVTGMTWCDEKTFPVTMGPDLTYNGSGQFGGDAFVAKVSASGSKLVYCGYIGGTLDDIGQDIVVSRSGYAYVAGWTKSDAKSFPITVGPDLSHNGDYDAFLAMVSPQGTRLVTCGYIGGAGFDEATGIAVDRTGNAFVAGSTQSDEKTFPLTVGPELSYDGMGDGYIARIELTLLEASGIPSPGGIVRFTLDATGDAGLSYVVGTSLGTGPIAIDTRKVDLSPDDLLMVTLNNYWPGIFSGYRGAIDSKGQAQAAIHIPNIPALIGVRLHSAFVTLSPWSPSGIKSISNTFTFSITK
jgi:hypothetical protein